MKAKFWILMIGRSEVLEVWNYKPSREVVLHRVKAYQAANGYTPAEFHLYEAYKSETLHTQVHWGPRERS